MADSNWISTKDSDNLTGLSELTQRTLLDAIKRRYKEDLIYTDVGDILVAVNPFCMLPIYGTTWSEPFCRPDLSGMIPHIHKTAARAYNAMVQAKKDQVCVISGESGAGKTESAKLIMQQVMTMCKCSGVGQSLHHKITKLNPILEAFGNAKTALNDNSSRFGKFVQLIFEPTGRIVGAGLEQYLLEKSRVCVQGDRERNFHIFYYLYAGLDQAKRQALLLKKPTEHRYLNKYSEVLAECNSASNKERFDVVVGSLLDIGFAMEEVQDVYSILAAVILIGDVDFRGEDGGEDNAVIRNPESVELVANLLDLETSDELSFALTTLRNETRGEAVDKRYKCSKAADVRDALAKALYSRLFQWIATRLNSYLQPYPSPHHLNIGILDIFGFENFETNSFEQFCINLANEQLQCYFNHQIFAMEKVELLKEGLQDLGDIHYTDNEPLLDLFVTKPIGLISLLDEQCRGLNGKEKAFVQRCKDSFRKHPNFTPDKGNRLQFTIHHYAGQVLYKINGFLEKNKDPLPEMLVESVKYGRVSLVRTLFRRPANPGSELRKSIMRKSQRSVMRAMSRKSFRMKKQKVKPQKMLTVAGHFQQSLKELMERMFSASPHFIRCIKPNYSKQPKVCDDEFMLKQLTYTGMLEAVRVRREGFSYRPYFSDFFNCYRSLAYHFTDAEVKGSESACTVILDKAGLKGWKLGKCRVFLRYFHEEKLHLMLKNMEDKAILIQRTFRGWSTRKRTASLREKQKREKVMALEFLSLVNTRGKECVDKLISLNKTDVLLSKERFRKAAQKQTFAPLSSRESFKALSTDEQRVRKAKQFGVQLMPGLGKAAAASPPRHRSSSKEEADDPVEDNSNTTSPTAPKETSSPVRLPPPTSPRISTPNKPLPVPRPVPRPRHPRSVSAAEINSPSPSTKSPSPFPRHRSSPKPNDTDGTFSPVAAGRSPLSGETVEGVVLLPSGTNGVTPNLRPVPKPRRPKGAKKDVNTEEGNKETNSVAHQNGGSDERLQLESEGLGIKRDRKNSGPDAIPASPVKSRIEKINGLQGASSREEWRANVRPNQLNNNAMRHGNQITCASDVDSSNQTSMSENLAKLRLRANSVADEKEEVTKVGLGGRALSLSNISEAGMEDRTWSIGSEGIKSPAHSKNGAPMADKRAKRRPRWRASSSSSTEGSPSHKAIEVIASSPGEDESDLDILGFYPTFNQNNAQDYILGQPLGTYLVYREEDGSSTPNFVLMVSLGRLGTKIYPIISIGSNFYLGNIEKANTAIARHMKGLLNHYRSHDLSAGLRLSQPRLLPGVLVSQTRNGLFGNSRQPKQAIRRKQ